MSNPNITFVYTDEFNKEWCELKLTKKHRDDFEAKIAAYRNRLPVNNHGKKFPGSIIKGTGGAYKYRYADPESTQGKSGSYRTIYFVAQGSQLWFLKIYKKNHKVTLTNPEKRALYKFSKLLSRKAYEND
ncbi:hypothetical protein C5Z26_07465 [Lactobacillus sp. CBA3606]|uniref:type II toxin-antitoxin system RelE/ParE family toxin n=1 Tax=Lactobacillus sp. CBA3606 TaxID=2099789 RepID=UPI000CFC6F3C|nr:type II toxin-antitoxin system RelE/ParE family toxin [Lactobacillus sp. CBA3606]AVK63956.1 hypothetical protein C5Z26_07465 [Lactobacillus sp. CBA3606]